MNACLLRLHSPDADLATYAPADPADAGVLVQLMVGPEGGTGEETFDVMVCTPAWLARQVMLHGPLSGRHHLIVSTWDTQTLWDFLARAVQAESGSSWNELAGRLARLGHWEFEDYQP